MWRSYYRAFAIGPEELAVAAHVLDVKNDDEALKQATAFFHEGLKRIEVWCGSRKVGDLRPKEHVL
jgi:hypothetical protein